MSDGPNAVYTLAEELPDHQTARGMEFRTLSVEDRKPLARILVIARSQAQSGDADWEDALFRRSMRRKKNRYFYQAARLSIDIQEATTIWWSVVHNDPSPAERVTLI